MSVVAGQSVHACVPNLDGPILNYNTDIRTLFFEVFGQCLMSRVSVA